MWISFGKRRIWSESGNTARADTAGLGSIWLKGIHININKTTCIRIHEQNVWSIVLLFGAHQIIGGS